MTTTYVSLIAEYIHDVKSNDYTFSSITLPPHKLSNSTFGKLLVNSAALPTAVTHVGRYVTFFYCGICVAVFV